MPDRTQLEAHAGAWNVAERKRNHQPDWLARGLLGLCSFYGAYVLSIALMPQVASFALERSQLGSDHFVPWAILAPAPFMYSFEHRVTVSPRPLSPAELAGRAPEHWFAVNHYPARALTFLDLRWRLFARPSRSYVYLDSRYRDQRLVTGYRVEYPPDDSGAEASILRLHTPPAVSSTEAWKADAR